VSRVYSTPLLDAIVASLRDVGPFSTQELADRLNKRNTSIRNRIEQSRHLFRVQSWRRSLHTSGRPSPVWALAIKHAGDAPRPEPLSRDEINRMWRERNAEKLRARYHARKRHATPWDALMPRGVPRT
jgi:hypothetical protein